MVLTVLISLVLSLISGFTNTQKIQTHNLASHAFSLDDRYHVASVNTVFKDNILLAIDYATGKKINPSNVDWQNVEKPFSYQLVLKPGQTFAFHDDVLPQYDGKVAKTTNAHFDSTEGFKSDGYLVGDGVCHLASFMYWVAKDAGLNTLAPTRHDFANIPDVPEKYGVSIYDNQTKSTTNEVQNLYITNNKNKDIAFNFNYNGKDLKITAVEL